MIKVSDEFSVLEILKKSTAFLAKKNILSAKCDVEWILSHFLEINKLEIYLDIHKVCDDSLLNQIRHAIKRRGKREPLQHILGTVDFFNVTLKCDNRALIPRPETEYMVELICSYYDPCFEGKIIDFGTGTGAIAISLCRAFPKTTVYAYDKSEKSLSLARENAIKNGVLNQIKFRLFDWHKDDFTYEKADLLVSNPPYLSKDEWCNAEPEVKEFDPYCALVADQSGIKDIKKIISITPQILKDKGLIVCEIGSNQKALIKEYSVGYLQDIIFKKDLCGVNRFLFGTSIF